MNEKKEEMLTVKQWAERAGIKLIDFSGFNSIYERLSGNESIDFYSYVSARFRDAGNLLCTRRGFEAGLRDCTIGLPEFSQYEKVADVIPNYIETDISLRISFICGQLERGKVTPNELRETIEQLLEFIKIKAIARSKSIGLNNEDKTTNISKIDISRFSKQQKKMITKHKGTVEELEEKLYSEIVNKIEKALEEETIKMKNIPLEQIDIYRGLLYGSGRRNYEDNKSMEEEYMYLDIPGQEKEEFEVPYRIIDGNGIREGVAFDMKTEDGRIHGTMRTNTKKVTKEISEESAEKSLQKIDDQVSAEQRKSLFARIKEFTRRLFGKSKDNNHEER